MQDLPFPCLLELGRNANFSSNREKVFSCFQLDFFTSEPINHMPRHLIIPSILMIKVQFSGEITFTHSLCLSPALSLFLVCLEGTLNTSNVTFISHIDSTKAKRTLTYVVLRWWAHDRKLLFLSRSLSSSEKIQWVIRCCSHLFFSIFKEIVTMLFVFIYPNPSR